MKNLNIYEDLGFLGNVLNNNPTIHQSNKDKTSNSDFAHNRQGIQLFKYNFANWQHQIINALTHDESIYVVASPGAGKTAPVMYSWAQNILKVNPSMLNKYKTSTTPNKNFFDLINSVKKILKEPEKIPKILYTVPTRTLCDQIYNEVSDLLYEILSKSIEIVQSYPNNNIIQYIQKSFNINISKELSQRQNLVNQYTKLNNLFNQTHNQNIERNLNIIQQHINNIDDSIYIKLSARIKNYVQNTLVQRATEIYTPYPDNALFIISVHQSAYSKVFKKVGKNIKTIIVDEAHKLQYDPNTPLKDKQDIINCADVLYKILNKKQPNTNVIFLSGTINPNSAQNLINYLNYCLGIKITQLNSSEGNASKISIIPDDSINNHNTLVNLLINPKENNNLIILFSKKLIMTLIQKALAKSVKTTYSAKDIDAGNVSSAKFQQLDIKSFNRNKSPDKNLQFKSKTIMDKLKQVPSAAEIEDPDLRMAVLHGFGYVFRPDKKTMTDSELQIAMNDQQIVVNLFSTGKLRTILATDAVGIGLNIKVKNVYIPTISKYNGVDFQKLGVADASQLYNRVGRRDFQISTIYTPEQNIDDILNAISAQNSGFEHREVIKMNKSLCSLHNFYSFYRNFY